MSEVSFQAFRETLWGSTDGRKTLIKDLEDSHLVNILNWVKDRSDQYKNSPDLHDYLEQEAAFRKLLCFAERKPYPVRNEYGYWSLRSPLRNHDDN